MRTSILAALLLASGAALAAQQTHFGENVDVHLIGIDAVVTDAHGNRVYGLKADDFEILERGKAQAITNFSEYRGAAEESTPREREPHSLLVLIDFLTRQSFVRQTVFRQLEAALPKLIAAGDHVSVVYWEPGMERSREVIESTDAAKIVEAIHALDASTPTFQLGPRKVAPEAGLMFLDRKTSAIERLVGALGAQPGRKAMLYVSTDVDYAGNDSPNYGTAKRYIDRISTAANANGVVFYAAVPECASQALSRVTDATGGRLTTSRAAVGELAPAMGEDLESYYSLAYRATSDGLDHERKITVKAKNPEYSVRARRTIVEKSNMTKARDAVVSRLFTDEGASDILFAVSGEPSHPAPRDRWLMPVVVKIPADQVQFAPDAHVGILVASANGVAEVTPITTNDLTVTQKDLENGFITYSFEILGDKRGSKVSIAVVDRRTGAIGVQTLDNRAAAVRSQLGTE
jgi:VWFA-related protein